jgi:uncharacterized protein YbjT (DUF2867 family)
VNVTVFGATGQIGRLVVADLLAGGHSVTAYVRNPATLQASSARGLLGRDKVGLAMSRADIAAFLVAQLSDHAFSLAAPAISN